MNMKLIALFCIFLFVSFPLAESAEIVTPEDEADTGASITVNVKSYEPTILTSNLLEDGSVPVYAFLAGSSVGTLLNSQNNIEPLYGNINIEKVRVKAQNIETEDFLAGDPQWSAPNKLDPDNLGYLTVTLKQFDPNNFEICSTDSECDSGYTCETGACIPTQVNLSFTADIWFTEAERLYSLSKSALILPLDTDEDTWAENLNSYGAQYSFYGGRGLVRVKDITGNTVDLTVYSNKDLYFPIIGSPRAIADVTLTKGETSDYIDLGYTDEQVMGNAKFRITLNDIKDPALKRAIIAVTVGGARSDLVVTEGQSLFPGSTWTVKSITTVEGRTGIEYTLTVKDAQGNVETITSSQAGGLSETESSLLNKVFYERSSKAEDSTQALFFDTGSKILNPVSVDTLDTVFRGYQVNVDVSELEGDITKTNSVTFVEGMTLKEALLKLLPVGYYYSVESGDVLSIKKFASADPCANAEIYTVDGLEETLQEVSDEEKLSNDLKLSMLCTGIKEFSAVVTDFDTETVVDTDVSVVEAAYFKIGQSYEAISLIDSLSAEEKKGAQESALEAYQELVSRGSSFADTSVQLTVESLMNALLGDVTYGTASLEDNGRFVYVQLTSVQQLTEDQRSSVVLTKDGIDSSYYEGDRLFGTDINTDKTSTAYNWYVYKVSEDSVQIRSVYTSSGKTISSKSLSVGGSALILENSYSFKAKSVDLKKEAYLTITPGTGEALHSTSNFSIHIPIESRAFDLNPDKIDDQIAFAKALQDQLDNTIEWLTQVVKTWNYVCLGVFAFVSLKSSFASASAQARHDAVHGVDDQSGWSAYCEENGGYGKQYNTYDNCMLANAGAINTDIQAAQDARDSVDALNGDYTSELSDISSGYNNLEQCESLLGSEVFLDKESQADYVYLKQLQASGASDMMAVNDQLESYTGQNGAYQDAKQSGCNNVSLALEKQKAVFSGLSGDELLNKQKEIALGVYETSYENGLISQNVEGVEIPTVKAFPSLSTEFLKKASIVSVGRVFQGGTSTKFTVYSTSSTDTGKAIEVSELTIDDYQDILIEEIQALGGDVSTNSDGEITGLDSTKTCSDVNLCKKYEKDLKRIAGTDGGGGYTAKERTQAIVADTGARYYVSKSSSSTTIYVGQAAYSTGSLSENYASGAKLEVYDSGEYKGLPYCLPYKDGNFIKLTAYTSNNEIDVVQLWNVGSDGQLCTGDDVLVEHESELHYTTADPSYNTLVTFANKWVKKTYYDKETVEIDSHDFTVSYGKSKATMDGATASCFDVMDPQDCKLLFHTCDPVMCPSSRFNLGGRWQVDSVVESGIIGSVILPQGSGDPVPLCLTGILASLNFWKSMLDGYVDCLEAAKYEGKSVGICDKIRSVYMCELLVREAAAIMDNNKDGLLDFLANKAYGQQDSGGGEYFQFKENVENVQNSVSYFTTEYSTTAFAAFKGRSLEEVGTTICQQAIYAQGPWFGDFMDQITTPEDPNQFYATLTVKPYAPSLGTSAYQTYYHLYAGVNPNIENVVYQVYLKNSLTNEVYYTTDACEAVSNSMSLGESVDQTLDCLAPEGFDTVCVVMNGETNCGFGSVSTSFGVEYLKDSIVADEVQRNITTEKDCYPSVSTASPTASSLATFGATDSLALPYSYGELSTGIQRVCALQDPGLGQGSSGSWTAVGSCGEDSEGRSLGYCWMNTDSFSIKDAEKSATASQYLETKSFETLKSGLSQLMNESVSREFYTAYIASLKSASSCSSYVSLAKQMDDLYTQTLSYDYAATAQYQLGVIYYMIGTDQRLDDSAKKICGITGRTQISFSADIDGHDVSFFKEGESIPSGKYIDDSGKFTITFTNLQSGEVPEGVITLGSEDTDIDCTKIQDGTYTCETDIVFTATEDIATLTFTIGRGTDAFTRSFIIDASEEAAQAEGYVSASETCHAHCGGLGGFGCDLEECHGISEGCYFETNWINECFACEDLANKDSAVYITAVADRCAVLSDDESRCTSETCYGKLGLGSGEKCYWDDDTGCSSKSSSSSGGGGSTGVSSADCAATGGADAYENALLDTIASTEGGDYDVLSGGDTFDFDRCGEGHPYYWDDKDSLFPGRTAWDSGRYQFIPSTYKKTWESAGLGTDFCEEGQDKGALYIINTEMGITSADIQEAYDSSNWDSVLDPIAKTWYGIPYSGTDCITKYSTSRPCGQGVYSYDSRGSAQPEANVLATFDKCYKEHAGITSSSTSSSTTSSTSCTANSDCYNAGLTGYTCSDSGVCVYSNGESVLLLGDSHSVGTYGQTLYQLFSDDGYAVDMYAQCGASPSWFVSGTSGTCGSLFIVDGKKSEVAYNARVQSDTPRIDTLNPETFDFVVISLGANLRLQRNGDNEVTSENVANLESSARSNVQGFLSQINSGVTCYWVGPPQGPDYENKVIYETFNGYILDAVGTRCTYIDSSAYTEFAFCENGNTFGCSSEDAHFDSHGDEGGTSAAVAWAQGIHDEISR